MKFFFIHKNKDIGKITGETLNFINTEEELKHCINKGLMNDYLKIPAFKEGDTVKIISKEENSLELLKEYTGKEFVVASFKENDGRLVFTEKTKENLFIVDLQTL